jgi:hypothetical protein
MVAAETSLFSKSSPWAGRRALASRRDEPLIGEIADRTSRSPALNHLSTINNRPFRISHCLHKARILQPAGKDGSKLFLFKLQR